LGHGDNLDHVIRTFDLRGLSLDGGGHNKAHD
jgi:hypothetical protein